MSILIFTLVVVVVLSLAVGAVQAWFPAIGAPPSAMPKNLICLLLVAIAIVAIMHRAGWIAG